MSEIGAGGGCRLMHGRTGWCWMIRAGSLAFGIFLSQWLVRYGLAWYRRNRGFDAEDVLAVCLLSVPIWLALVGWWWHLALAASLSMVSVVLLGYAGWEHHWSGRTEEVVGCTRLGSVLLVGAFLVLLAWWNERERTQDS
ncbi:MAG: hypothetical protein A2Y72_05485 [Chloroflexi bacterium RBG_13_53_26]|jgi:hypothetical protein|nr:MAG: hypothetical protein A2Y72_05485 [Chloroflexi bacterium RBG_13_53_26]